MPPTERRFWVVRAGSAGEDEEQVLSSGLSMIGFRDASFPIPDDWNALREQLAAARSDWTKNQVGQTAGQLFRFAHEISEGDFVVLPRMRPLIAVGVVAGPYEYRDIGGKLRHTRRVRWIRKDIPRDGFGTDVKSLDVRMTVFRIWNNKVAERIGGILDETELDLKSDEGLRRACEQARARLDSERVRETAKLLKEVQAASVEKRATQQFQTRVWDNKSVWEGGISGNLVTSALEDSDFREWFAQQTVRSLASEGSERTKDLHNIYRETTARLKQITGWVPIVETLRTFAIFFPRDFTGVARKEKLFDLLRKMGLSGSGKYPVQANRRILDRLIEVIGPVDPSDLDAVAERMLLGVALYGLLPPVPADRLKPMPAAARRRGLTPFWGGNGFDALRETIELVGNDGISAADLRRGLTEKRQRWNDSTADHWVQQSIGEFRCMAREGDTMRLSESGRKLHESGDPDELMDRLLTGVLGPDHIVVSLRESALSKGELIGTLQAANPGWKAPTGPEGLLRWMQWLDVIGTVADGGYSLTERGARWSKAVWWDPERLAPPDPGRRVHSLGEVMRRFRDAVKEEKLQFPEALVESLHLGLWADRQRHFAVLAGLSGTGKTQLAVQYGKALTGFPGETGGPVEVIAVQPGWHDPGPLLGYVNPLADGAYQRTEFLYFLLAASKKPGTPHVLVLDEMNLSHPEQYFAPMLSAMERKGGEIALHRGDAEKLGVPTGIPYPENLVIIGTVNMDETTMGISDKVLDRAFTLEFWDIDPKEWPGWTDCSLGETEKSGIRQLLTELTDALRPAQRHFGWRVIAEAVGFLEQRTREADGKLDATAALDAVIYAKVLPKVRGDDTPRFRKCLEDTRKVLEGRDLEKCARKVKELQEDLDATGSASFWRRP